jgi:hypothetical protein
MLQKVKELQHQIIIIVLVYFFKNEVITFSNLKLNPSQNEKLLKILNNTSSTTFWETLPQGFRLAESTFRMSLKTVN